MTYVNFGSVIAIGVIFSILAVLSVVARIVSWRRYWRKIAIDDVLIVPAAIIVIGSGILVAVGAGVQVIGGHSPSQTEEQRLTAEPEKQIALEKYEYPLFIMHVLSLGLSKLAFLFFLRRIFQGRTHRTPFDYINWSLITLVTLWTIAFTFAVIFGCGIHVGSYWGTYMQLRNDCINTFSLYTISSILNFAMDLAVFIMPLVMISTLHMRFAQKLQASVAFLFALFAVGTGLTRMVLWILVQQYLADGSTDRLFGLSGTDEIGLVSVLIFWMYVEMGVSFVVACLAPCRKLFDDIGRRIKAMRLASLITRSGASRSGKALGGAKGDANTIASSNRSERNPSPRKSVDQVELESIDNHMTEQV